jgi:hypothetical protein
MKKTLVASLALSSALFLPLFASADNLLTNGSFEMGLDGWTLSAGDLATPATAIDYGSTANYPLGAFGEPIPADDAALRGTDEAVGSHALYFVDDFANPETLTQRIARVQGGTPYSFGFDAYIPANGFANPGDATFSATVGGYTFASFNISAGPVQNWVHFQAAGTPPVSGPVDFTLTFTSDFAPSKDVVIDDVYFAVAVPEPETYALLIAGLGAVGFMVRRRKH